MDKLSNVWILVPARGGSKGIPRKNLRLLAGTPLILHTLVKLSGVLDLDNDRIIVSTDDEEIACISEKYAVIHRRSSRLADDKTTLDEVALDVVNWLIKKKEATLEDYLLTVQPTSPFLSIGTIIRSVDLLVKGAGSVISVVDDRHLRWRLSESGKPKPLFSARVNRQWMSPMWAETGGVIGTRIGSLVNQRTRIVEPVALVEVDEQEGLDIDTHADWAVAEYYARRKKIVIRADASPALGMGHVYRALALAYELSEHDLCIVTRHDGDYSLGERFLTRYPYRIESIQSEEEFIEWLGCTRPDVVILDILDTSEPYVLEVHRYSESVVSLEDLGDGTRAADVVINDLYTDLYPRRNHWYGVEYAILNPQFETAELKPLSESVDEILVAFGGTDPQNLTMKALLALEEIKYDGSVTVVLGPGYPHGQLKLEVFGLRGVTLRSIDNMPLVMSKADMAITSAGRTVTELMTLGVPTIVMCQNSRELRHTHASSPFGVINLGLGEHIDTSSLAHHISMLISDYSLRSSMRSRSLAAVRNRSNTRVAQKILQSVLEK